MPNCTSCTWCVTRTIAVQRALVTGCRGLLGGTSLARLLAERRGKRYRTHAPRQTVKQILAWADAHPTSLEATAVDIRALGRQAWTITADLGRPAECEAACRSAPEQHGP